MQIGDVEKRGYPRTHRHRARDSCVATDRPLPNPRFASLSSWWLQESLLGSLFEQRVLMHAVAVASPQAGPLLLAPACPPPLRKGGDEPRRPFPSLSLLMFRDRPRTSSPPLQRGGGLGRGRIKVITAAP